MRRILNFGSLNIDHVYTMPQIVAPGQTLPSHGYRLFAGGKGANQSAALALAGARVSHAGRIGEDGRYLLAGLDELGVDTQWIQVDPTEKTGHAIIQVETASGENAILLYPGANHAIEPDQIRSTLDAFGEEGILLLQNEISHRQDLLTRAADSGLEVVLNPAPFTPDLLLTSELRAVDLLIVNETEAAAIAGMDPSAAPADLISAVLPCLAAEAQILLTRGAQGAVLTRTDGDWLESTAFDAGPVVDTTAAGDTFIGYFLAARSRREEDDVAMMEASVAAALCVTRPGARDAIPGRQQVLQLLTAGRPTVRRIDPTLSRHPQIRREGTP